MWNDYIVEEVRKTREKLAEESSYDLHKAAELIRAHQKASGLKIITKNEMDIIETSKKKHPA